MCHFGLVYLSSNTHKVSGSEERANKKEYICNYLDMQLICDGLLYFLLQSMKSCVGKLNVNKSGAFFSVAQLVFHVEEWGRTLFCLLKLLILMSTLTRFHCFSWDSRISDCCLDRYESQTRSFTTTCS